MTSTYVIGIDLGTTNTVAAYTEANPENGASPEIRVFQIPQVISAGTTETREMLPSFILVPGPHDVPENALALPWEPGARNCVGEFARNRGAELPQRLIASAKSWLCHPLVDRNQPILPWEGGSDAEKMSPVDASAAILRHIRDAWNHTLASQDQRLNMEYQTIYLAVPASFDAVARALTVQAAAAAGLDNVTLIEEPQAAFYAWIAASGHRWREAVQPGDLVLVCDVGGGTSDFSLISVTDTDGELTLERIAVGDHLLVGGDNMDLALAYRVSKALAEKGIRLDAWQMRGLWHSCRAAKEKLFAGSDPGEVPVTILGRGSSLIGGAIRTSLTSDALASVIVDGFFPRCEASARPVTPARSGIRELGLSYEADPAVTRHLAQFLGRQKDAQGRFRLPTAVLFNGGVMKAPAVRRRILETFSGWGSDATPAAIREIESTDFDLAVARGAAYYGLACQGDGIRIRGGLGRSYYLGIAASMPSVPGMPIPIKALCVAPFGMEEGSQQVVPGQQFVLVTGEPVKFDFLASSIRRNDAVGAVIEDWEAEIEPITTLETTLDGEPGRVVPVTVEIKVTAVGTLELWCVAINDGKRWKLEFNVREKNRLGSAG
jgi:molecular chaperone DnaK (HSP70)